MKVKKVFNQTFYSQFEGSLDDISVKTASGSCYKDRWYHTKTQERLLAAELACKGHHKLWSITLVYIGENFNMISKKAFYYNLYFEITSQFYFCYAG